MLFRSGDFYQKSAKNTCFDSLKEPKQVNGKAYFVLKGKANQHFVNILP